MLSQTHSKIAPWYGPNRRDAFSHSGQCDALFSGPAITHPGTGKLVTGFEQSHTACRCWCHNAEHLFESAEPEWDLTPPPEYATSADLAFAGTGARFGSADTMNHKSPRPGLEPQPIFDEPQIDPQLGAQCAGRSRKELQSGKCDTCGDPLTKCECVE